MDMSVLQRIALSNSALEIACKACARCSPIRIGRRQRHAGPDVRAGAV